MVLGLHGLVEPLETIKGLLAGVIHVDCFQRVVSLFESVIVFFHVVLPGVIVRFDLARGDQIVLLPVERLDFLLLDPSFDQVVDQNVLSDFERGLVEFCFDSMEVGFL